MARRSPQWINSTVLFEALIRYQEGRLPRSMRLWVEQLLELEGDAEPGSLAYYGGGNWHKWRIRAQETLEPYVFG